MDWPPNIPPMPALFGDLFRAIIGRIDFITPRDGKNIRFSNAPGGGLIATLFGALGAASTPPPPTRLKLISASDGTAKAGVVAGSVQAITVDGTQTVTVADGNDVWLEFALTYDPALNLWTIDSLTGMDAGTFPTPPFPLETTYLKLGTVAVTGSVARPTHLLNGSQAWIRVGNVDTYQDYFSDGS